MYIQIIIVKSHVSKIRGAPSFTIINLYRAQFTAYTIQLRCVFGRSHFRRHIHFVNTFFSSTRLYRFMLLIEASRQSKELLFKCPLNHKAVNDIGVIETIVYWQGQLRYRNLSCRRKRLHLYVCIPNPVGFDLSLTSRIAGISGHEASINIYLRTWAQTGGVKRCFDLLSKYIW